MLLLAAVCWAVWMTRNRITFENLRVRSPLVTVFYMCSLLYYWAGLFGDEDGALIRGGADDLMRKASQLAACSAGNSGVVQGALRIAGA